MTKNPSETTRSAFNRGNTKYSATSQEYQWLVGVTDGDGTFYFGHTPKGNWTFTFKVGQSNYNLRLLYHIKNIIGAGSVSQDKSDIAEFRIRDIKHIIEFILPIFDSFPLLTSKYFNYAKFKEAILIANNSTLTKDEKNKIIFDIKQKTMPIGYISPAWNIVNNMAISVSEVISVMSKAWIIGFTEAEGSFYLVKKGPQRMVHAFEITQKLDRIVLEAIALILGTKVITKKTYNTVIITNFDGISSVVQYFFKTMKGMKALEYRIWARSFTKHYGDFESLTKIRDQMRNIRSIRLDKDFHRRNN